MSGGDASVSARTGRIAVRVATLRKLSGRLAIRGHMGMRRQYTSARRTGRRTWRTAGDATRRAYHQTATLASVTASTQGQEAAAADASRVPAVAHHSGA